jgi:DNA polymerase-3 subunit delta'
MRSITLQVPSVSQVAALITAREGVDEDSALTAAREAQSHIGMATRLATDEESRRRRDAYVAAVLGIGSVSQAMAAAGTLLDLAKSDADALVTKQDSDERDALLKSLGLQPGGAIPPALRSHVKALEEDQKRRSTRSLRDAVDRILVDVMSVLRDVLMLQVGAGVELVNQRHIVHIEDRAVNTTSSLTLSALDAVNQARARMSNNSPPLLVLESLLIQVSGRIPAVSS